MSKSRFEPFHRKAYDQYGSSMGRHSDPIHTFANTRDARCRRVPLDRGGYDKGGAYWGTGAPLWCVTAEDDEGSYETYLRAPSREAAKAKFPSSVRWTR